jgi:hypothetical protein
LLSWYCGFAVFDYSRTRKQRLTGENTFLSLFRPKLQVLVLQFKITLERSPLEWRGKPVESIQNYFDI